MKIYLDSIGCRLNQSEIEKMAAQFRADGNEIVANAAEADLVVVNTCAVTAAASSDSRSKIRQAARAGKARIVVTGCYATIDQKAVAALPETDLIIPNTEKDKLVTYVLRSDENSKPPVLPRKPLPGAHRRTRAFIKVQDGCDNYCSFCITRLARGASRSQSESEILEDIRLALDGGAKEIVLSGVNIGAWGRDLNPERNLAWLIDRIIAKLAPPRIRLSSLEPWDINAEFLDTLNQPGFCQHLHLPLQSGSDTILKRMGRRIRTEDFELVVIKLRRLNPKIAITTDVMVGFPSESEELFEESLAFVNRMMFAGGHVFNYSNRPGTPAEKLSNQVPSKIRKIRSAKMREVIGHSAKLYQNQFIGGSLNVLWEKSVRVENGYCLSGISDNNLRIQAASTNDLYNEITQVEITEYNGLVLIARDIS